MIFSFLMGSMIDRFELIGETKVAFTLTSFVILVLMILHTLTMMFTVEKEMPMIEKKPIRQTISEIIKNKDIVKVTIIFAFYHIANHIGVSFYGTYQIHELGLSLKFVSAIAIVNSVTRICVSKVWGRYADKKSFAVMIEKCFIFLGLSYVMAMFATPSNRAVMFALYFTFNRIALGGINSALINLVFDYVKPERRSDSLAICQAVAGVLGFVTTLVFSPFATFIQQNGNKIFGLTVYAQQILSLISIIVVVVDILYVHFVLIKKTVVVNKK